jgi:E3 ubiquitin-protein ligase DOA10
MLRSLFLRRRGAMTKQSRFHRAMKRRKELERQGKKKEKELRRETLRKAAAEARARGEEVFTSDQEMATSGALDEPGAAAGEAEAEEEAPEETPEETGTEDTGTEKTGAEKTGAEKTAEGEAGGK